DTALRNPQPPNPQLPINSQPPTPKNLGTPNASPDLGKFWELGIGSSLGVGRWNLGIDEAPQAMRFLHPDYGWWILATFTVVALLKWRLRWRYAAFTAVLPAMKRYRASQIRRAPFIILALAAAFTGLAVMQPVIPYSQADLTSRGLDIALLIDLSSSMQEEMGSGQARATTTVVTNGRTRMDAVKDAVRAFIRMRRDDRIGLVVFSDNPYVISPLTFDHQYLLHYVDFIDDKILQGEGQTAIGDGLALSNYMLSRQATATSRGHQVIVLFTDG